MTILEIGDNFSTTQKLDYPNDRNFMDFDFIIIDYRYLLARWAAAHTKIFIKEKSKLEEFIKHKDVPLIVFLPEPRILQILKDDRTLLNANIAWPLPVKDFEVQKETGKILTIKKTPFEVFFNTYKNQLSYHSHANNFNGKALIDTPYTNHVVSFYNDQAVFLPLIANNPSTEIELLNDLTNIVAELRKTKSEYSLPSWQMSI